MLPEKVPVPKKVELPAVPEWKEGLVRVSFETTGGYKGSTRNPAWKGASHAYEGVDGTPQLTGYGPYDGSWPIVKVLPWSIVKPITPDHGSYTVVLVGGPGFVTMFVAHEKHRVAGQYQHVTVEGEGTEGAAVVVNVNEHLECGECL